MHVWPMPPWLSIPAEELGQDSGVTVTQVADRRDLAERMAEEMFAELQEGERSGRGATLIVPVGPVDQFPVLAEKVNAAGLSLGRSVLINMDEYLTDADEWIATDHPLSFRGFMEATFYSLLDPALAPPPENRVMPDPRQPDAIGALIDRRGGVDACFGGIGINGHMAFNEPPEPGESVRDEEFRSLPTRVLSLSRETRTINANTVGGSLEVIPRRAITVGMREILGARRLRFYCNRPWQSAVVRRVLHGPIGAACPASFLRTHSDAAICVTGEVAAPPQIALR